MKKIIFVFAAISLLLCFGSAACSSQPDPPPPVSDSPKQATDTSPEVSPPPAPAPKTDVTLNIWTNMTGVANDVFAQVCLDFTHETGIQVDYAAPANDYESLMRTKMATNDMPDIFSTHGWSVMRYSSFLRPLNDQPWYADIAGLIKPVITDPANGNIYVLPVDMDIAGLVYNRDILSGLGFSADDIITWSDFEVACVAAKDAGYIPVFLGGRDDWTIGQFFDWVAPSFFVTNDNQNYRNEFLNGSFDWNLWGPLADKFAEWNNNGFFNIDAATADYDTITMELGQGNVLFAFFGNYAVVDGNSKGSANLGMMPLPALYSNDTPTLIAGERLAVGAWKDTTHEEEALAFLSFLARPDIMSRLATANGNPAGIAGVESDTGAVSGDLAKYANLRTFPYFDRVYLPSGMWNDLCDTGLGILNATMSTQDVIDHMRTSFQELFNK
jgi:raffinose/stachyose/melibiose transport system substrate-binding protein